ncbi:MAG: RNA polymerase sigma-70 factor [Calditrichia bacterium]
MSNFNRDISDRELVIAIKKSDKQSFRQLYLRYSEPLYRFLWRKLRDPELANDLLQDVFLRFWQNRLGLDENRNIKSYLFQSANNRAIDHFRKLSVRQELNPDTEMADVPVYPDEYSDVDEQIRQAVDKLPTAQRNVLLLSKFEGLKYQEISEVLNISPKTVENHMNRALKKLRQLLGPVLGMLVNWFSLW